MKSGLVSEHHEYYDHHANHGLHNGPSGFLFHCSLPGHRQPPFWRTVCYADHIYGSAAEPAQLLRHILQDAPVYDDHMLYLSKETATVVVNEGASALPSCNGSLKLRDVHFSYDNREAVLTGLDFHCAPGTNTAFVRRSGGDKFTVFCLFYRFCNTESGSIEVDGNNISHLNIRSARRHIGVVPQDTMLSINAAYNLKYADPEVTDEQFCEACRTACIHGKIPTFPEMYEIKIGERGLRLSGGEKQRAAHYPHHLEKPEKLHA